MKVKEVIKYYPEEIEFEIISGNERRMFKGKKSKISRLLMYRKVKEVEPYIDEKNKVVIKLLINEVIL